MDHSGNNSGSMQSSSGGDDQEYDSRNESISLLFNPSLGSISNHQFARPLPPYLSHYPNHQPPPPPPSNLYDPQLPAQNLHAFPNSPPNLDLVWSRSDPNYSNLGNLPPLSSTFPPSTQSQLGLNEGTNQVPLQSVDRRVSANSVAGRNQINVGKNSRKRSRASRRAPTTVLTTDTSNFRQMVQEFTGIPASPFPSLPCARPLDLFGGGGGSASALGSGHLDTVGPLYTFRPTAQKVQHPFLSSSSSPSILLDAICSTGSNNDANTFSNNYSMSIETPIMNTFHSLAQSNGPTFDTKSQGSLGIPGMDDELGMAQLHANATNLSSEFSIQLGRNHNNLTRSWRGEEGCNDHDEQLGSFDESNGPHNGDTSNYKMNGSG